MADSHQSNTTTPLHEIAAYLNSFPKSSANLDRYTNPQLKQALSADIEELQRRVDLQHAELEKLRSSVSRTQQPPASSTPQAVLLDLLTTQSAFESLLKPSALEFPPGPHQPSISPSSAFTTLLSIKTVNQDIHTSLTAIPYLQTSLAAAHAELQAERKANQEYTILGDEIQKRIKKLSLVQTHDESQSDDEDANEQWNGTGTRYHRPDKIRAIINRASCDTARDEKILDIHTRRLEKLRQAFLSFIDRHLADRLELEDQGKIIVGDKLPARLTGGGDANAATSQPNTEADNNKGLRQRRIDEMFGSVGGAMSKNSNGDGDEDEDTAPHAGEELKELVGTLIRAYLAPTTDSQYLTLERESAAARFLVRAKIAKFHPRKPLQIALVGFAD